MYIFISLDNIKELINWSGHFLYCIIAAGLVKAVFLKHHLNWIWPWMRTYLLNEGN